MVDFIKIYWPDKSLVEPFVCNKDNFDNLYSALEQHSGEINYPYRTSVRNMKVVISANSCYVKNSLHKLYNDVTEGRQHNHNDFSYSKLVFTIDYLCLKLKDVESAAVTQIEFGLNIETLIAAENIIERNVLMHKYKGFNHNKEYHGKGKLKQFDYYDYLIKIYDKAKQYNLPKNLLRFEIKLYRKIRVQAMGIITIHDLKNKVVLQRLFNLLLQRFEEMIIIDELQSSDKISKKDAVLLSKYVNPNYWQLELADVHTQYRARKRKEFISLLEKYDLLKTKNTLRVSLNKKFEELINN